ncbi:ubiquitin-like small modifier protein SAMP2 [Halorubrum amylolyticum]|uniref:ubiquitin-like small modifier protein SAMP2 n=1 Tax=Halorubrum amylolyticum TaxID=2508724 RepID=UPI001008D297|nr:ubiquitin-like small modifier protein 2 [Halorubrum amylolyticum]
MNVTVEVVGEGTAEYDLPDDATYADLIREAGYHPQEASALVDGSPVPGDRVVDAEEVRLLRLIKGGSTGGSPANDSPADGGA